MKRIDLGHLQPLMVLSPGFLFHTYNNCLAGREPGYDVSMRLINQPSDYASLQIVSRCTLLIGSIKREKKML